MKRRDFLTGLACVAGSTLATKALPAAAAGDAGPMHGAGTMPHAGSMTGAMPAHPMSASVALAPRDAIPRGRAFTAPVALRNEASESGRFRATLVAAPSDLSLIPGVTTQAWTYNGQFPGPLIELQAGDEVEIALENHLGEPTTIHWHGLPVPSSQDGNPGDPVASGGRRVYRFKLPGTVEGLYWYHPHPHGRSSEQVYRGLAGPIRIRSKDDRLAAIPERIVAVTDLRLARDGAIPADNMLDWMNGREGQFPLVNGLNEPVLRFDARGHERWHILNATNARYLRLVLTGHRFTLLGTDGGRIETARTNMPELLLAPAQRAELLVAATGARSASLMATAYARGKMGGAAETPTVRLMEVDFSDVKRVAEVTLPQHLREFAPLPEAAAHKRVVMSESMSMGSGSSMTMDAMKAAFLLNGKTFDLERVDLRSQAGTWEDWEIVNNSDMDHPFHVHGTQFAIIERVIGTQRRPERYRAWHDTVNLEPKETVRIRIMQPEQGIRMFHCHLLEHEDLGMMGRLLVT